MPTIALITDFGLSDPYVGQMKAVIDRLAPGVPIIDVSHRVAAFNITQAAFFLAASAPHFAAGTIFICVVDPGVGSQRKIVLLRKEDRFFIAPDNGLLGLVLAKPGEAEAFDVTGWREPESSTFHGRDIFAHLGAELARGRSPSSLGPTLRPQGLVKADWAEPRRSGSSLVGSVLHIDHFGNAITNLAPDPWLETIGSWGNPRLARPKEMGLTLCRAYGGIPRGQAGLIQGSQGYLELAVNRASAAQVLGLKIGTLLRLTDSS